MNLLGLMKCILSLFKTRFYALLNHGGFTFASPVGHFARSGDIVLLRDED